jgi:hypothetical protein
METGARAVSHEDIVALTNYFGLDDATTASLSELARSGRRRASLGSPPPTRETDYVKIEQTDFVELERDATTVREFNSGHVPGLLQTVEYMWASMAGTAPDVTPHVIEQAIAVRTVRQRKFYSEFQYEVIIDEAVLARRVGDPDVMAGQAQRILELITQRRVEFMVIPFSVGAHPGANSQFVSLSLPQAGIPGFVFSEGLFGHAKYGSAADISRFDRVWMNLKSLVEPHSTSLARLRAMAAPTLAGSRDERFRVDG